MFNKFDPDGYWHPMVLQCFTMFYLNWPQRFGHPTSGALRELRNQRKKPKTAEDLLLHGSDLMIPGPAPGGPGTSLHATVPAEKRETMGGLQALRQEKKYERTT